jgi:hypothetical protein
VDDFGSRYSVWSHNVFATPFSWGSRQVNKMIGALAMMVSLFLYVAYSSDG